MGIKAMQSSYTRKFKAKYRKEARKLKNIWLVAMGILLIIFSLLAECVRIS